MYKYFPNQTLKFLKKFLFSFIQTNIATEKWYINAYDPTTTSNIKQYKEIKKVNNKAMWKLFHRMFIELCLHKKLL